MVLLITGKDLSINWNKSLLFISYFSSPKNENKIIHSTFNILLFFLLKIAKTKNTKLRLKTDRPTDQKT